MHRSTHGIWPGLITVNVVRIENRSLSAAENLAHVKSAILECLEGSKGAEIVATSTHHAYPFCSIIFVKVPKGKESHFKKLMRAEGLVASVIHLKNPARDKTERRIMGRAIQGAVPL